MTSSMTNNDSMGTPTRSNYAEPHTPIASAKRPRNPKSAYANNNNSSNLPTTTETHCGNNISEYEASLENSSGIGNTTPQRNGVVAGVHNDKSHSMNGYSPKQHVSPVVNQHHSQQAMSPMHPPRRVPSQSHGQEHQQQIVREKFLIREDAEGQLNENDSNAQPSTILGALFSPVLNFLNNSPEKDEEGNIVNNDTNDGTNAGQPSNTEDASSEVLAEVTVDEEGDFQMNQNHQSEPTDVAVEEDCVHNVEDISPQQSEHQTTQGYYHTSTQEEVEVEDDDDEEEDEFNPYVFIKNLPAYDFVVQDPSAKICLPKKDPSDPPITLVLDLDETLVHCTVEPIPNADMVFPVMFHGVMYKVHVRCRPFLTEFLEAVYQKFEVVVFTASQQVYADELLNRIDPEGKYIKHRMFRESCLLVQGNYLKDLHVLGRDLKKAVLVDNSPHAFGYQVDNGIPIESWFDDPHDSELVKLEQFLQTLHGANDVTTLVRAKFQTYKLIRNA